MPTLTARLWAVVAAVMVLVAIAGGLYLWGRNAGKAAQASADGVRIDSLRQSLRNASSSLTGAANALREIDFIAKQNAKQADEWKRAAKVADTQALKGYENMQKRLAEISRQDAAEQATCPAARAPICGAPLR